jgi:hypothetical protein
MNPDCGASSTRDGRLAPGRGPGMYSTVPHPHYDKAVISQGNRPEEGRGCGVSSPGRFTTSALFLRFYDDDWSRLIDISVLPAGSGFCAQVPDAKLRLRCALLQSGVNARGLPANAAQCGG